MDSGPTKQDLEELAHEFSQLPPSSCGANFETFLKRVPESQYLALLVALIKIEIRRAHGRPTARMMKQDLEEDDRLEPRLEIYLHRFPKLNDADSLVIELAAIEYALRFQDDEDLQIESYLELVSEAEEPNLRKTLVRLNRSLLNLRFAKQSTIVASPSEITKTNLPTIPVREWKLPVLVGPYFLTDHLGSGGMGSVFAAFDTRSAASVAVKLTRRNDAWSMFRFNEEINVLASLQHPNLVDIFESFTEGDCACFSMRFVNGKTLDHWWRGVRSSKSAFSKLLDIAFQLASVLEFIHARGFIHGDIKPANILVDNDCRLTLVDLGLSFDSTIAKGHREFHQNVGSNSTDMDEAVVGTLEYLAPEVRDGAPNNYASDWYSTGVVLSDCILSRPEAKNRQQCLHDLCQTKTFGNSSSHSNLAGRVELFVSQEDQSSFKAFAYVLQQLLAHNPAMRMHGHEVCQELAELTGRAASNRSSRDRKLSFGRDEILDELESFVTHESADSARIIRMHAEQGLGKTHLLEQLRIRLAKSESCITLSCIETPRLRSIHDLTFCILRDFIRAAYHFPQLSDLRQNVDLINLIRKYPKSLDSDDATKVNGDASTSSTPLLDPRLVQLLQTAGEKLPICILIDNIHDLDSTDLELLLFLHDSPIRLKIISTELKPLRQKPVVELSSSFWESDSTRTIELRPLDSGAVLGCINHSLEAFTSNDHAELKSNLATACKGNPARLFALVDLLLKINPNIFQWSSLLEELKFLSLIEIKGRLLTGIHRYVLELLSVNERAMLFHDLRVASRVSPEKLISAIGSLNEMEWIRTMGLWPDYAIEIRDSQIRHSIRQAMTMEQLQRRHYRIARTLAKSAGSDLIKMSYHYREAGKKNMAANLLADACEQAKSKCNWELCVHLANQAIECDGLGEIRNERIREILKIARNEVLTGPKTNRPAAE